MKGRVPPRWAPPAALASLRILNTGLKGRLWLWTLPNTLRELRIEGSKFRGVVGPGWVVRLPSGLQTLSLARNLLGGWAPVGSLLPPALEVLDMSGNAFNSSCELGVLLR